MKPLCKMLAASALFLTGTLTASAQDNHTQRQETRHYPYAFVGVQGGVQAVLNGYNLGDVVRPVTALQVGGWFSPALGARLQANGWQSKEGVKRMGTYKFTYASAGVDAMVDLTNAFSMTDDHAFHVILLGGLGANKAWGSHYRDLRDGAGHSYLYNGNPAQSQLEINSRIHNHVALQTRVGVLFDLHVAQRWSVSLEGDFNHIGSRSYAHELNGGKDWQFVGLLGVTYKFGSKAKRTKPQTEPQPVLPPPAPAPEPQPEAQPTPQPEIKPQPEAQPKAHLQKEVYFVIARTVPTGAEAAKVADVAAWLKAHPTAKATIKGYADKGTGNAAVNARYARGRAQQVAKELTEKYGIAAARLEVSSYGDTVQPFAKNEDNRVVIVVGQEP